MKPGAIIVHEFGHAIAALAAARELATPICLWSAPDAASYAGIGWFDGIIRQLRALPGGRDLEVVLDCGDRAELVQAALRQGLRSVCYVGDKRIAKRLADIARQSRAKLHLRRPPQTLDLLYVRDPAAACRRWLSADKRAD
jgi:hypothetical protein